MPNVLPRTFLIAQTTTESPPTMTNDYDPFNDYDPNREVHQRINQTLREATTIRDGQVTGPPIVTDWSEIDSMAEVANNVPQSRNHDMRRLAGATV
jgi:hypothetical protein